MHDDPMGAFLCAPEVQPAKRIRVQSHETSLTASGWAPEVRRQIVFMAPVSDLLVVLEAFSHGH